MRLFLTGIDGFEKDEIGKKAAELLKLTFFNLSDEIEAKLGMSKQEIIQTYGEENYKNRETIIIKQAADTDGIIASVSEDAIRRRSNIDSMCESGTVIFIDKPKKFIYDPSEFEIQNDAEISKKEDEFPDAEASADLTEQESEDDIGSTEATEAESDDAAEYARQEELCRLFESICDYKIPAANIDEAVKLLIRAVAMILEGNTPAKQKMDFRAMMRLLHDMDRQRYSGELIYINEMAEENDTYPSGEEINEAFAEMNGKSAVFVNNMQNSFDSDAVIEMTVVGKSDRCIKQIIDENRKENKTFKYCVHTDREETFASLKAAYRSAAVSTENEYILDRKAFEKSMVRHGLPLVKQFGTEEFDAALDCPDETTAQYVGEYCRELGDTVKAYGIIVEGAIACVCVIEIQSNGFENIAEPIWVYTDKRFETRGLATLVLQSALSECIKEAEQEAIDRIIMYRCDADNAASQKVAQKCGFAANRKIYTLEFEI